MVVALPPIRRGRAPPDAVARLGRGPDPAGSRARDRHEHLVRRRRLRDVRTPPRRSVRACRRHRDRRRALPPVRDRPTRQPHARLRHADTAARRGVRGDNGRARCAVVGGDSAWVVALATLVVAIAFRPLRSRIQDLVDRRYRRARYEGVRLVRAFEDEVRAGARAPEEIGPVLADALRDPLAEILFWIPETDSYADDGAGAFTLPRRRARRHEIGVTMPSTARAAARSDAARAARPPRRRPAASALSIEMARCGSRCASSSPRSRRRARGSWKRATRSGAASSATCTTERSSGSSRSASRSDASSHAAAEAKVLVACARPDRGRGRRGDRGSAADRRGRASCAARRRLAAALATCADVARSRRRRRVPRARRRERRGRRLLRRLRGAHERREARLAVEGRRQAVRENGTPLVSVATTGSAARSRCGGAPVSPASATASPRTVARRKS